MIEHVQMIEDWQMRRLLDILVNQHTQIRRQFPGFITKGYLFRTNGQIDWIDVEAFRLRYIKTLGRDDLQFDQDTLFRLPHRALQVQLSEEKLLVVGFWVEHGDPNAFIKWLQEYDPYVTLDASSTRALFGQFGVD